MLMMDDIRVSCEPIFADSPADVPANTTIPPPGTNCTEEEEAPPASSPTSPGQALGMLQQEGSMTAPAHGTMYNVMEATEVNSQNYAKSDLRALADEYIPSGDYNTLQAYINPEDEQAASGGKNAETEAPPADAGATAVLVEATLEPPSPLLSCKDAVQHGVYPLVEGVAGTMELPPQLPEDDGFESCSVFFARVPPTVPHEAILELFQQYGHVRSLNLFRPWASAKTSKGCGIVDYETSQSASAAMAALHMRYHWTGGETTMVVEWVDPARHRRDRGDEDGAASKAACHIAACGKPSRSQRRRASVQHARAAAALAAASGTAAFSHRLNGAGSVHAGPPGLYMSAVGGYMMGAGLHGGGMHHMDMRTMCGAGGYVANPPGAWATGTGGPAMNAQLLAQLQQAQVQQQSQAQAATVMAQAQVQVQMLQAQLQEAQLHQQQQQASIAAASMWLQQELQLHYSAQQQAQAQTPPAVMDTSAPLPTVALDEGMALANLGLGHPEGTAPAWNQIMLPTGVTRQTLHGGVSCSDMGGATCWRSLSCPGATAAAAPLAVGDHGHTAPVGAGGSGYMPADNWLSPSAPGITLLDQQAIMQQMMNSGAGITVNASSGVVGSAPDATVLQGSVYNDVAAKTAPCLPAMSTPSTQPSDLLGMLELLSSQSVHHLLPAAAGGAIQQASAVEAGTSPHGEHLATAVLLASQQQQEQQLQRQLQGMELVQPAKDCTPIALPPLLRVAAMRCTDSRNSSPVHSVCSLVDAFDSSSVATSTPTFVHGSANNYGLSSLGLGAAPAGGFAAQPSLLCNSLPIQDKCASVRSNLQSGVDLRLSAPSMGLQAGSSWGGA